MNNCKNNISCNSKIIKRKSFLNHIRIKLMNLEYLRFTLNIQFKVFI